MEPIEQVLQRVTDEWMTVPGVVGTGLGLCDGRPCIKVFATRSRAELGSAIPESVGGHPVVIEPTTPFQARDTAWPGW